MCLCLCDPLLFLSKEVLRWVLVCLYGWKRVCVCRQITTDVFAIICVAMALVARVTIHDVSSINSTVDYQKWEIHTESTPPTNNNNYTQCGVHQTNEMVNTPHRQSIYVWLYIFVARVHSIKLNEMLALDIFLLSPILGMYEPMWMRHRTHNKFCIVFVDCCMMSELNRLSDWFMFDPIQHC